MRLWQMVVTNGRAVARGCGGASVLFAYRERLSSIQLSYNLSNEPPSQSSHTTTQPSALIPSVISHNYIIINPILQKFISYHLYNALIARNRLNPKHLTINLQCPISIVCQHSLSKHLSKLYAFLIEAVDIP